MLITFSQGTSVGISATQHNVSIRNEVGSYVAVPWHDMLEILNCNELRRVLVHRLREAQAMAADVDVDNRDVHPQHVDNSLEELCKSLQVNIRTLNG